MVAEAKTLEAIIRIVRSVMDERLPPSAIIDSDTQFEEIGVDSFEAIQIISAVEESFKVCIDPADAADAFTIGELDDIVRRLIVRRAQGDAE